MSATSLALFSVVSSLEFGLRVVEGAARWKLGTHFVRPTPHEVTDSPHVCQRVLIDSGVVEEGMRRAASFVASQNGGRRACLSVDRRAGGGVNVKGLDATGFLLVTIHRLSSLIQNKTISYTTHPLHRDPFSVSYGPTGSD